MPFEIIRNDIVNMDVETIVNSANHNPIIGSGVDERIHSKASHKLLEKRKEIGVIDYGDAIITLGFNLDVKYIIHTVVPRWSDGKHKEEELLTSCYRKCLELAKKYQLKSISFPLLGSGNMDFSSSLALKVAIQEISNFLLENEMYIYLVVFDKESFKLSKQLFNSVKSYIDENYVEDHIEALRCRSPFAYSLMQEECKCAKPCNTLDKMLEDLDEGFSNTLLHLNDFTGKKDSQIYKKANIDRKLFSKIRNNPDYKPSKTTAIAFALALELDLAQTKDFIARAGFALSHSSKFDVIIEYFIIHKNYNIFELNEVLFAFDQPLIGS